MKNKKWKLIIILLCITFFNVQAQNSYEEVEFVRCVDGDTAMFKKAEEEVKYRFLAIDTPETVHPTKEVEEYGKDASEYTCNKLANAKEIIVEYESSKTDKYGRTLAWIWVDGDLLQSDLVKYGYAEVAYIYGNYKYTKSLCLIQQDAKTNNLGIWYDGKREEGYCSTVDLEDVTNNIKYSFDDENIINEEDAEKETLKSIDNINNKIDDVNDALNDEKNEKIIIIIFLVVSIISYLIKSKKK